MSEILKLAERLRELAVLRTTAATQERNLAKAGRLYDDGETLVKASLILDKLASAPNSMTIAELRLDIQP